MALKLVKNNVPAFLRNIKNLTGYKVLVGVPAANSGRHGRINNASLAYIHNYGSPLAGIPPRPFMEPGIKNVEGRIKKELERAARLATEGKETEVKKAMERIGLIASTSIKKKINDGPFTPLKPATLAARRRRGRTGIKPLIDTGQLRNSITYVVEKK